MQQRSSRSEVNVQTIKSVREEETHGVKTESYSTTEDQTCESVLKTRTMTSSPNTNMIIIQEGKVKFDKVNVWWGELISQWRDFTLNYRGVYLSHNKTKGIQCFLNSFKLNDWTLILSLKWAQTPAGVTYPHLERTAIAMWLTGVAGCPLRAPVV